ncbi:hypothetical protein M885DRAFT_513587 [Pelagophyceae sp. CCMP2097]|nr:hypothetical protein M885DRAFT_513587 [Pelagophyceae sp. CCMP2097]
MSAREQDGGRGRLAGRGRDGRGDGRGRGEGRGGREGQGSARGQMGSGRAGASARGRGAPMVPAAALLGKRAEAPAAVVAPTPAPEAGGWSSAMDVEVPGSIFVGHGTDASARLAALLPEGFVSHAGATTAPSVVEAPVEDPYDPTAPNDYAEVQKERDVKRSLERRERQRQTHLERLESDQERLASERQEALKAYDLAQVAGGRGGVSNLPAWMKSEKQLERESALGGGDEPARPPAPAAPAVAPAVAAAPDAARAPTKRPVSKRPTRVLLLKNMVAPGDVDAELTAETSAECSKYGAVDGCRVLELAGAPEIEAVRLYIKFASRNDSVKAFLDLEGRFFAGRKISCEFFDEARYDASDLSPIKTEAE